MLIGCLLLNYNYVQEHTFGIRKESKDYRYTYTKRTRIECGSL
jgi:hypothetical protein